MNTYLVPIYNDVKFNNKIQKYIATSIEECQEKIMLYYSDIYDKSWFNWEDFCVDLWNEHGIFIGEIKDVEELL